MEERKQDGRKVQQKGSKGIKCLKKKEKKQDCRKVQKKGRKEGIEC